MKRKILVWMAAALAVIIVGSWVRHRILANRDKAEFQEQLRLARAEGLPTSGAEFAATIEPAKPEENAAQLYRDLKLSRSHEDVPATDVASFARDPKELAAARKFIERSQVRLAVADRAASLPRCWFDRDWSVVSATLLPEFADMKSLAKLVALRGALAAMDGDERTALRSIREVFVISKHASEEGHVISALVGEAIYLIGVRELADWCVVYPQVLAYRRALGEALEKQPKPDLRRENRDGLCNVLLLVDLSLTKAGRTKIGLKDEDLPTASIFLSSFFSQPRAKIAIVKAERDFWAALKLPPAEMEKATEAACTREYMALNAFPVAAGVIDDLESRADVSERVKIWQLRRIETIAVQRALRNGPAASSIDTRDLKSPYDGKPLTYSFDGRQIEIMVTQPGASHPPQLKIPPDKPKRT